MESNYKKLSFVTNVSCILHEGKRLITYFIIHPFLYKTNFRIKIQQTRIKEIFEAYITFKIYVSTKRFSNILCKNYIDYSGHLYQNLRHFWTTNELE